jgi:autotransporter-associated beta strand protein
LLTDAAVTINHNISVNNFGGSISLGGASANSSTFNSAISLAKSINLTSAAGGAVGFTGAITGSGGITASGTGTVSLSGANGYGGTTNVSAGTSLVIAAAGALPSGSTILNNGSLAIYGNSIAGNISGTGTLSIGGTSPVLLQLAVGSGVSSQNALNIASGSTLDLTNNHLIINYGNGADPIATLAGYLDTGFAGGAWNGAGISSSAVEFNSGYGLGYADGADGVVAGLLPGQIEVKYTLYGDANLDGSVNGTDFGILAANFGKSVSGWDQGDFNYNGTVNGSDFALLAANFGKSASGTATILPASDWASLDAFAAAHGLLADVPEPSSLVTILFAGAFCLRRRGHSRSADRKRGERA